jgi:hypothetical protein
VRHGSRFFGKAWEIRELAFWGGGFISLGGLRRGCGVLAPIPSVQNMRVVIRGFGVSAVHTEMG